jgi:hypothetical protein
MSEAVATRPDKGNVTEAKWTLKRVDELVRIVNQSYLELSELLYKVREHEWFRMLEGKDGELYATFEEYVADRLGWKDRKAQLFVRIQKELMLPAGLKREDMAGLDYSKAYHLSTLPPEERTPEKMRGWLEKAKTENVKSLTVEVNKVRNRAESKKAEDKRRVFRTEMTSEANFLLDPDQRKNVELALEVARKVAGPNCTRGFLLDMVCLEFLSDRIVEGKVMASRLLKRAEEIFGIMIVAWRETEGGGAEIEYGEKAAKKYGIEIEHKPKGVNLDG